MYRMSGLGVVAPSEINWWCWDAPGFKACHGAKFAQAQQRCRATANAGYADMDNCVARETDIAAIRDCPCPAAPPVKKEGLSDTALIVVAVVVALAAGYLTLRAKG